MHLSHKEWGPLLIVKSQNNVLSRWCFFGLTHLQNNCLNLVDYDTIMFHLKTDQWRRRGVTYPYLIKNSSPFIIFQFSLKKFLIFFILNKQMESKREIKQKQKTSDAMTYYYSTNQHEFSFYSTINNDITSDENDIINCHQNHKNHDDEL